VLAAAVEESGESGELGDWSELAEREADGEGADEG
jgi:hypothetical protein